MQIQAISLFNLNNSKISKQNNPKQQYNNLKFKSDSVSFKGNKNSDETICNNLLIQHKINPFPRLLIQKELKKFKTNLSKSMILRELLNIGKSENNTLDTTDITDYLNVLSGENKNIQLGAIDILKYEMEFLQTDSGSLNNNVFLPLENHDNLTRSVAKLYNKYKKLPSDERKVFIGTTFDILVDAADSGKDFSPFATKIAQKMQNMPKDCGLYLILLESVKCCDSKKFGKLLNKLDEKTCEKLYPIAEDRAITPEIIDEIIK